MKCPKCGREVEIPKASERSVVVCPLCGEELLVGTKAAQTAGDELVIQGDRLVRFLGGKSDVFINGNVKVIGNGVFQKSNVEFVYIADGVRQIGAKAFANCPKLKQVSVPNSVTKIARNAFAKSKGVTLVAAKGSCCYEMFRRKCNVMQPADGENQEEEGVAIINQKGDPEKFWGIFYKLLYGFLTVFSVAAIVVLSFLLIQRYTQEDSASLQQPGWQLEETRATDDYLEQEEEAPVQPDDLLSGQPDMPGMSEQENQTEQAGQSQSGQQAATPEIGEIAWSKWDTSLPANVREDTHEVDHRTVYRTRKLETKTSNKSTMSGWELYDEESAGKGYGSWSDWSQTQAYESSTRQVQVEVRYRYRDYETTTSTKELSGWTLYDKVTSYGEWSSWSDWSTTKVEHSETKNVQTATQYRSRSKSNNGGVITYGAWSSWSNNKLVASDTLDVEKRTLYRYATRTINNTYYYERWGSWSQWQTSHVEASGTRDVDSASFYRYRDMITETTYYFRRWGEWSDWSETPAYTSDTLDVESKEQFRYRPK